jgi:hypothetical protein
MEQVKAEGKDRELGTKKHIPCMPHVYQEIYWKVYTHYLMRLLGEKSLRFLKQIEQCIWGRDSNKY